MLTGLIKHGEGQWCTSQKALGATSLSQMKLWSTWSLDQVYPFLSFPIALKWKQDRCRKQPLCDQRTGA